MSEIFLVTTQTLLGSDIYKIIGVEESLSLLTPLSIIGVDTETSGIDCHNDELLTLQLGCSDFQVIIDCTTVDVRFYKDLLESEDRLFLFWNAKFDLKWLYKYRIVPRRVYDGFLAEKLMWLGYPAGIHSMSLKSAGYHYLGIELDKSIRGQIIYKGIRDPKVIEYAAYDVKYLEQIMKAQAKELQKKGLTTAIEYENRFVLALSYIEYCGVKVDKGKWLKKMESDQKRVEEALTKLNEWYLKNVPDPSYIKVDLQGSLFDGFNTEPQVTLNWNSAKQMIPIFKRYGIDCTVLDKETRENKDSIDAKVLKPQKEKCDLIPLYLEFKEAVKVTSTYGENFLKQLDKKTGRLYTNYQQLGADTTRITSGGKDKANKREYINFLNLPADAETRACFVAENGNKWISIDYSGQETFLLASIANDEAIIKELTEGSGDIHSLTAYMSYKQIPRDTPIKDIKKKYHDLRQEAKGIE